MHSNCYPLSTSGFCFLLVSYCNLRDFRKSAESITYNANGCEETCIKNEINVFFIWVAILLDRIYTSFMFCCSVPSLKMRNVFSSWTSLYAIRSVDLKHSNKEIVRSSEKNPWSFISCYDLCFKVMESMTLFQIYASKFCYSIPNYLLYFYQWICCRLSQLWWLWF